MFSPGSTELRAYSPVKLSKVSRVCRPFESMSVGSNPARGTKSLFLLARCRWTYYLSLGQTFCQSGQTFCR